MDDAAHSPQPWPNAAVRRERFLRLVAAGLDAVWPSLRATHGEVALVAVTQRVLCEVRARHPAFHALSVDPGGLRGWAQIEREGMGSESEVREAGRGLLIALITRLEASGGRSAPAAEAPTG